MASNGDYLIEAYKAIAWLTEFYDELDNPGTGDPPNEARRQAREVAKEIDRRMGWDSKS
jgi:hypothetical protein